MEYMESNQIMHCTGNIVPCEKAFKNKKIIILYFANSTSASCKQFLQKLKQIYSKSKEMHLKLEIIYVCFDENEEEMKKYFTQRHGGWYAVPFGDPAIWVLRVVFDVTDIPSMVVLGEGGRVISKSGMMDYNKYGLDVLVAWHTTIPR